MPSAALRSGFRFLLGPEGFLRGLGADYRSGYRRDFHPDRIDDAPLIALWRPRTEAEIA